MPRSLGTGLRSEILAPECISRGSRTSSGGTWRNGIRHTKTFLTVSAYYQLEKMMKLNSKSLFVWLCSSLKDTARRTALATFHYWKKGWGHKQRERTIGTHDVFQEYAEFRAGSQPDASLARKRFYSPHNLNLTPGLLLHSINTIRSKWFPGKQVPLRAALMYRVTLRLVVLWLSCLFL